MAKRKPSNPSTEFLTLYSGRVADPGAWIRTAMQLMAAALALEPSVTKLWEAMRARFGRKEAVSLPTDVHGVYFVLIAYALENLMKALIVSKRQSEIRQLVESTKSMPPFLKSHNLVQLAGAIGLQLSNQDEDLLRRLTRHAEWAGRYPIPASYEKSLFSEKFSDGGVRHIAYLAGADTALALAVVIRVATHLYDHHRSSHLEEWIKELMAHQAKPSGSQGATSSNN